MVNMDDIKKGNNQDTQEEILEEEQTDATLQELQSLKDLTTQLDNQLKRSLADYQNLQRRTMEEKREWIKVANKELILKLLPVLDTLILAGKHIEDKGLQLSIDQFLKLLEDEGVRRIEAIGKDFDPQTMEAVSTKNDKKMAGKVVEEMRAGYVFGDTVLRAAQVIVGA